MIFTSFTGLAAYRMHSPKWAVAPTSGAGAAMHGGRLNRPGIAALYLSLDTETAIREYQQLSSLVPPGTLVSYQLTLNDVVDFSAGYDSKRWPALWESFYCDWRELWFNQRIEPPTWVLGDQVIAAGGKGILFRSSLPSHGLNLVLYPDTLESYDNLSVFDPSGTLPKNYASWQ